MKNADIPEHAGARLRITTGSDHAVRTLADIARIAGVSAGTVSRALAGRGSVRTATRQRIEAIAGEYGFRPNQMASKLRSGKTGAVAVLFPPNSDRHSYVADWLHSQVFGDLTDVLMKAGFEVMLPRVTPGGPPNWLEPIVTSGMIDGVIVVGQRDQFQILEDVAGHYLPMIVWGQYRAGQSQCSVGIDNEAGGRIAAEHLVAGGSTNLLFLGDFSDFGVSRQWQGASMASALGQTIHRSHVPQSGEAMLAHVEDAVRAAPSRYDGIIAASDEIAMAVIAGLHRRNVSVPHEVQVVGFGDVPLAAQSFPPLTTIRNDFSQCIGIMIDKLRMRIAGQPTSGHAIRPHLIVRKTTRASLTV